MLFSTKSTFAQQVELELEVDLKLEYGHKTLHSPFKR